MPHPDDFEHALSNQMSVVIGYAEMLLESIPPSDSQYADVLEILKAARAALALLVARRESSR